MELNRIPFPTVTTAVAGSPPLLTRPSNQLQAAAGTHPRRQQWVHTAPSDNNKRRPPGSGGVALIIGAGDATGGAIARRFARGGVTVAVARRDRDGTKLAGLVSEIGNKEAAAVHAFSLDARCEEEVDVLVERIENELGPITAAVHNIGANIGYHGVVDTTAKKYFKVWEMAAFSAFLVGRAVAARMRERGEGTIIFTGATASTRGAAGHAAFSGAMCAKRALAQSMAREFGPQGIHVAHVVIDGVIDTQWTRALAAEGAFPIDAEAFNEMADNEGILRPDDIAEVYWNLHMQPRNAWTFEMDVRPWTEKW